MGSQAVMKEGLRIHPSVGFPLERYVPEGGATICGVELSAGTTVSTSGPLIHRNKDIFGRDADKFLPERWIDSPPEQIKAMERNFLSVGRSQNNGVQYCTLTTQILLVRLRSEDLYWEEYFHYGDGKVDPTNRPAF